MASYVALVYDGEEKDQLGCELYCIFSNFDDSQFSKPKDRQPTLQELLRTDGQAHTTLQGNRKIEDQLLTNLMKKTYGEDVKVAMRRLKP